jgi:hypothetical protein
MQALEQVFNDLAHEWRLRPSSEIREIRPRFPGSRSGLFRQSFSLQRASEELSLPPLLPCTCTPYSQNELTVADRRSPVADSEKLDACAIAQEVRDGFVQACYLFPTDSTQPQVPHSPVPQSHGPSIHQIALPSVHFLERYESDPFARYPDFSETIERGDE